MVGNNQEDDLNSRMRHRVARFVDYWFVSNVFLCDERSKIFKLFTFAFNKTIKPTRKVDSNAFRFETQREYGSSMRMIATMMKIDAPDGGGKHFKDIIFDLLLKFDSHVKGNLWRPKWHKKIILLEQIYRLWAAYRLYDIKKFVQEHDLNEASKEAMFLMGLHFGFFYATIVHSNKFSIKQYYKEYHKVTQGLIQGHKKNENSMELRAALRTGLREWKNGNPADHSEMAKYLNGLPEFSHLELKQLRDVLLPYATRARRARGLAKKSNKFIDRSP